MAPTAEHRQERLLAPAPIWGWTAGITRASTWVAGLAVLLRIESPAAASACTDTARRPNIRSVASPLPAR